MGSITSMSARGRVADGRAFVLAGAMLLAVAMGVGRFAYTPIIPIMERDAGLTVALAGTLASSNLFGYFVGSLLTFLPALRARRLLAVRCAIATVVVTTAAMAIPSPLAWLVLRFLTGVASGVVLVFASSIVIDRAVAERRPAWPGLFFGGVGIGVALTGALAAPLVQIGGSRASWIGLAFISALAVALTVPSFTTTGPAAVPSAVTNAGSTRAPGFPWLAALYGIQGFSYVIPATFIVALVADTPATARFAASSWIVVGCVAAVSTTAWAWIAARVGKPRSLVAALLLQGVGAVAAVELPNAFGVVFAAFALGGTFMGMTGLATGLARDLRSDRTAVAIGQLTALYSVGQILGPLVATALVLRTGSYHAALLCAAGTTLVSAALAARLSYVG